jgi:hypothetical protein
MPSASEGRLSYPRSMLRNSLVAELQRDRSYRSQHDSRERDLKYSFSGRSPLDEKCLDGIFLSAAQTGSKADCASARVANALANCWVRLPPHSFRSRGPLGGAAHRQVRSWRRGSDTCTKEAESQRKSSATTSQLMRGPCRRSPSNGDIGIRRMRTQPPLSLGRLGSTYWASSIRLPRCPIPCSS